MLFTAENSYGDIIDKVVADFGCGCGTLSTAAALIDAASVIGFDIDPQSLEITTLNAEELEVFSTLSAAIGTVLTGYISAISWDAVFYMLMTAALFSGLLLTKLIVAEVKALLFGSSDEVEVATSSSSPASRAPIDVLL